MTKILRNCDNANLELCKVANWLAVNKLSLNLKKTNFVIFRAKTKKLTNILSTNIGNQNIEQVNTTNFLKLTIDQDLSWKHRIKKVVMIRERNNDNSKAFLTAKNIANNLLRLSLPLVDLL